MGEKSNNIFKQRIEDKPHKDYGEKIMQDSLNIAAKAASKHHRNPEEAFGYTKEKLREGEFNPILSS